MGSSGGRDYPSVRPELDRLVDRAQADEAARLNSVVNDYLQQLLAQFNGRDADAVNGRLDSISELLDRVCAVERVLLGGSVAKHTDVDGVSDVDALIVLDRAELAGRTPGDVKALFAAELASRLPRSEVRDVHEGPLAVTVTYKDGMQVQLVPALRSGSRTQIASADGGSWISIRPHDFRAALTTANQRLGNALVPAIKLMKAINDSLPKQKQLKGYHIEAMAVEAAKGYSGPKVPREVLVHLVSHASDRVLRPIADITGQSRAADEYLGASMSLERRNAAQALSGIRRRLEAAKSLEEWRSAFE